MLRSGALQICSAAALCKYAPRWSFVAKQIAKCPAAMLRNYAKQICSAELGGALRSSPELRRAPRSTFGEQIMRSSAAELCRGAPPRRTREYAPRRSAKLRREAPRSAAELREDPLRTWFFIRFTSHPWIPTSISVPNP